MRKHLSEAAGLQRLAYGAAAGVAVGLAPWPMSPIACGLLGWSCGTAVYLLLAWWLAETFDADHTRARGRKGLGAGKADALAGTGHHHYDRIERQHHIHLRVRPRAGQVPRSAAPRSAASARH